MEAQRLTPLNKFWVSATAERIMVAMFWGSEAVFLIYSVSKGTTVAAATLKMF